LVFVQIWLRWSLPRLRIDQVMITCLKYLVPISCFLFLGATVWPLFVLNVTGGRSTLIQWSEDWSKPLGTRYYEAVEHNVRPTTMILRSKQQMRPFDLADVDFDRVGVERDEK